MTDAITLDLISSSISQRKYTYITHLIHFVDEHRIYCYAVPVNFFSISHVSHLSIKIKYDHNSNLLTIYCYVNLLSYIFSMSLDINLQLEVRMYIHLSHKHTHSLTHLHVYHEIVGQCIIDYIQKEYILNA